jgi:hypothetical protein
MCWDCPGGDVSRPDGIDQMRAVIVGVARDISFRPRLMNLLRRPCTDYVNGFVKGHFAHEAFAGGPPKS